MKQTDIQNRLEQVFVPGKRLPFVLPLDGHIMKGKVIVRGEITLGAAGASGDAVGHDPIRNIVERVIVRTTKAAGSPYGVDGEIVNCTPESLLEYAVTQRDGTYVGELNGSNLGNGAAGTYEIYLSIPIFFADANIRRQTSTALNANPYAHKSISVEVKCGSVARCFDGNTRVADYSLTVEWMDEREDLRDAAGKFLNTLTLVQEDHESLIDAKQERHVDGSMPTDGAFLMWLALALTSIQSVRTLADTILNKLALVGPTLDYKLNRDDIKQRMIDDAWYSKTENLAGRYLFDFTDGLLSKVNPAVGLLPQWDVEAPGGANASGFLFYTRRVFSPAA